jgi:Telomere resolvase
MGKRGWLERLLEDKYLPVIGSLDDSSQGRNKAQKLLATIREDWIQHGAKTLRQQQSLMNQFRSAIKQRFGEQHFSVEVLDFSRDEHFELNTQKQESARNKQLHQQYIKDPDAIVAQAVRLLNSPEWADVAAGLAVLTGRRLNEVLKTAQFTIQSQWVVRFSGALKRRGELVPLIFDIPTLTTAKRIVEATERLRQITPTDVNEAKVAQASDRHFHHLVPAPVGKGNLYAHLWRSLYCCIATFWYCPKHVDDLLFKAHIMGHFETLTRQEQTDGNLLRTRLETFASQRHYRLYEIDDELIAYYQGKRKGIKLGLGGIQPLDTFTAGLPENQPEPMQRKHRSSLRVWKEDHDAVVAILQHFHGKTQPDRVAAWIEWSLDHLNQEAIASLDENNQGAPSANLVNENSEAESKSRDDQPQEQTRQALPSTETIQSSQSLSNLSLFAASGIETRLDKLIEIMALFVQSQMQGQNQENGVGVVVTNPSPPSNDQTHQPAPTQNNSQAKPRKYKTGEADITINRAIDAIITHNDQPNRLHDDKWAITINGLKNYSSNQRAIERIIQARKEEIELHHAKHQLAPRHNDRHKRKHKINDVVTL